jgi:hypothetical protein
MQYEYNKEDEDSVVYTEEELLYREGLIDQIKEQLDELTLAMYEKEMAE